MNIRDTHTFWDWEGGVNFNLWFWNWNEGSWGI